MSNENENSTQDRLSRSIADMNGAMNTAKQGFSLLGSLFTMALWAGVAAVAWNFMPDSWKDGLKGMFNNLVGMLPSEWIVGLNQMTGLFDGAAFDALRDMDPNSEQVTQQLTAMGVTGELQTVVQSNWDDLLTLSQQNGGSTNDIITEGVITQLFTNEAHRPLARQIIGALGAVSGNGGEIPQAIKAPLEAFINGEGFEAALNDADSRELIFEALVEIVDTPSMTVEKLEQAYAALGSNPELLRDAARTVLNGADAEEAMQALLQNPEVIQNAIENPSALAEVYPEFAEYQPVLEMLQASGFEASEIGALAASMTEGNVDLMALLTTAYAQNATATNAMLSDAANLARLAELLPADAEANAFTALLQNPAGREALAQLVADVSAVEADFPARLIAAMTLENADERSAAVQALAGNAGVHAALLTFKNAVEAANVDGTESVVSGLAQLEEHSPEVIAAANAAPAGVSQAVQQLERAAEANRYGLVGALMDDNLRNRLLGEGNDINGLGGLLAALNRPELAYITQTNTVNGEERYDRLKAVYNFIAQLDAGTGGAEGSAEEMRADAANAKAISFLSAWLAGGEIEVTNSGIFTNSADRNFKVTTADGQQIEMSAKDMADFFEGYLDIADPNRVDANGNPVPMAMGTLFNQLFANLANASTPGTDEHDLFSFLVDNFWEDKNNNNAVDADEGLKAVFNDAYAWGRMLDDSSWDTWSGVWSSLLRNNSDNLDTLRELGQDFAEELGSLTAPVAGAANRSTVNTVA